MLVFDFILDLDDDILFKDGDLAIGESTELHQRDLVVAMPGEFRQWPTIGAGIRTELLNSITPDEIRVALQRELERDGLRVARLLVKGGGIEIDASYGDS